MVGKSLDSNSVIYIYIGMILSDIPGIFNCRLPAVTYICVKWLCRNEHAAPDT